MQHKMMRCIKGLLCQRMKQKLVQTAKLVQKRALGPYLA
jgi:hypothetical protein